MLRVISLESRHVTRFMLRLVFVVDKQGGPEGEFLEVERVNPTVPSFVPTLPACYSNGG